MAYVVKEHKISVSSACKDIGMSRGGYYYQPAVAVDEVEQQLLLLANNNPRYGCRKLWQMLRLNDYVVNHKKVSRLYKKHALHLRLKSRKRIKGERQPAIAPASEQKIWSLDFVHDKLVTGRKTKALTILDEFNREGIDVHIDTSINSSKLIRKLDELKFTRGLPEAIRSDNGPEFTAIATQRWAKYNNVKWIFIQPGKPTQNCFCERFNGTYRNEVLNSYLFDTMAEFKLITRTWLDKYNYERPHDSLKGLTPMLYKEKYGSKLSTLRCA